MQTRTEHLVEVELLFFPLKLLFNKNECGFTNKSIKTWPQTKPVLSLLQKQMRKICFYLVNVQPVQII